ncbi:MAG: PQQ-binding-like beta-propeller repeat protein [Gemmatimonadaceae bacterium]|nr:PQQ-binding-like beta-propeller repeat protein [Gemmatimonadaceae bacterium]
MSRSRYRRAACLALALVVGGAPRAPQAQGTPRGTSPTQAQLLAAATDTTNWLYATHDYSGARYAAIKQITPANAARLAPVCAFQVGDVSTLQTNPIVVDGVMILTTSRVTMAIDARSCKPKWRHTWKPRAAANWPQNRGVAVKDGLAVRGTSDGYLVALDLGTGKEAWVKQIANADIGETLTMPPMIYDDLVIIGPAGSENAIGGWIGGFRLATGDSVWRFRVIPPKGQPGSETWKVPAGTVVGGGAVWTAMSLDVKTGLVFAATTNPAPDFAGGVREGDNLYTNSIVALNARTGRVAWYRQLVPHDTHDWDVTQAGPLYEATIAGKTRSLMATAGKDGMLRVLDRDSHAVLFATPVTTRENADTPVTTKDTHACPGVLGGVEWSGPSYNPITKMLYTPAVDWCGTFKADDEPRHVPGKNYLGGDFTFDSPTAGRGWLTAVDAVTGAVRWKYHSPRPMVGAVTSTAGGVVMTGELTGDFVVFNATTGKEVYRFNTGGSIGGGVATYSLGGTQYVAVASGSPSSFWTDENPGAPTIFVFALKP